MIVVFPVRMPVWPLLCLYLYHMTISMLSFPITRPTWWPFDITWIVYNIEVQTFFKVGNERNFNEIRTCCNERNFNEIRTCWNQRMIHVRNWSVPLKKSFFISIILIKNVLPSLREFLWQTFTSYGKYPSLGPLMYMRSKFYIFWSGLINLMHSDWNLF